MKNLKKTLSIFGSQKDIADLLGISYSYLKVLIYTERKIPLNLCKKIIDLSKGQITMQQLRSDLNWLIEKN